MVMSVAFKCQQMSFVAKQCVSMSHNLSVPLTQILLQVGRLYNSNCWVTKEYVANITCGGVEKNRHSPYYKGGIDEGWDKLSAGVVTNVTDILLYYGNDTRTVKKY